jgi:hypothetical protein
MDHVRIEVEPLLREGSVLRLFFVPGVEFDMDIVLKQLLQLAAPLDLTVVMEQEAVCRWLSSQPVPTAEFRFVCRDKYRGVSTGFCFVEVKHPIVAV